MRARLAQEATPVSSETIALGGIDTTVDAGTSAVSWLLKFALVDWSGQNRDHELRALVDWDFRNRLLAQPGVASLVVVGGGVSNTR